MATNPSAQADALTERLVSALAVARDELADAVEKMARSGLSAERIVASLADPTLRAELGLDRESLRALFEDAATTLLVGLPAATSVTPEMLDALTTVAEESFLATADRYFSTMQRTLTNAV
ncbi:MAG: hypothetical protein KDB90_17870, partial [Planctomycetes bacterium]|nr:hypothetical protein [Planctomycetota bacterium]